MSNFKIKLKYKEFEIELEGDKDTVKEEFKEIKENGLGNILNGVDMTEQSYVIENRQTKIEIPQETANNVSTVTLDSEFPSIKDVVMQELPKSESEWIIVYSFYASEYGEKPFKNKRLLDMYELTKRKTESRLKNLSNNLKTIFKNRYLSALNDIDTIITEKGKKLAKEIINRTHGDTRSKTSASKKSVSKTSGSNNKKNKSKGHNIVKNLNLRENGKKSIDEFVAGLSLKSNLERNTAFLHYLKYELEISLIGLDHIYTCYRHLKLRVPVAFYQSIADTGVKGWIDASNTEDLTLTGNGLNYVEHDLQKTD